MAVRLTLPSCERLEDADEEIFILYTEKQSMKGPPRGLGFVDSLSDILDVRFDLEDKTLEKPAEKRRRGVWKYPSKVIDIQLHQDKTALRSRKGDTGSVLWQSTYDFAQLILQQHFSKHPQSLLIPEVLGTTRVLELGAGTGLLSLALSPLVRHYTVTDIAALVPLIRKNVASNLPSSNNIMIQDLDWLALTASTTPLHLKHNIYNPIADPVDLILAVDCIYHPSLIPPFVDTLDYLTLPGRTQVLIVSELRAEDVLREFLERWIATPGWEIWRLQDDQLEKCYAVWVGHKVYSV